MGPAGQNVQLGRYPIFPQRRRQQQGIFHRHIRVVPSVPEEGGRRVCRNLLFQGNQREIRFIPIPQQIDEGALVSEFAGGHSSARLRTMATAVAN